MGAVLIEGVMVLIEDPRGTIYGIINNLNEMRVSL